MSALYQEEFERFNKMVTNQDVKSSIIKAFSLNLEADSAGSVYTQAGERIYDELMKETDFKGKLGFVALPMSMLALHVGRSDRQKTITNAEGKTRNWDQIKKDLQINLKQFYDEYDKMKETPAEPEEDREEGFNPIILKQFYDKYTKTEKTASQPKDNREEGFNPIKESECAENLRRQGYENAEEIARRCAQMAMAYRKTT